MSRDSPDDPGEAALQRVRADPSDEQAWAAFYDYFRRQVAAALFRSGVRRELPDMTQDVLLRFLERSPWSSDWTKLPGRPVVTGYLRSIAQNLVVSRFRSLLRRPQEESGHPLENLPASFDVEEDFRIARLAHLTEQLKPEEQGLLRLVVRGVPVHAIAFEYGITYSAAAVRIHRLRQRLKRLASQKAGL